MQYSTGQLLPELHSHAVSKNSPPVAADPDFPILSKSPLPIAATSTCDIYKGTYLNKPCALKVFRGVAHSAEAKRVTIGLFSILYIPNNLLFRDIDKNCGYGNRYLMQIDLPIFYHFGVLGTTTACRESPRIYISESVYPYMQFFSDTSSALGWRTEMLEHI